MFVQLTQQQETIRGNFRKISTRNQVERLAQENKKKTSINNDRPIFQQKKKQATTRTK